MRGTVDTARYGESLEQADLGFMPNVILQIGAAVADNRAWSKPDFAPLA